MYDLLPAATDNVVIGGLHLPGGLATGHAADAGT